MRHHTISLTLAGAAAAVLTATALPAGARTQANDPLCGLPRTTSLVLTHDVHCDTGDGIVVGASGITLDLGGFTVDGSDAASTAGIRNPGFSNVKIVHGTVTDFATGVVVTTNAAKNQVQGLRVQSNTGAGVLVDDGSDGVSLRSVFALGNGGDGFRIHSSSQASLDRVRSIANGSYGIEIDAAPGAKVTASGSSRNQTGLYAALGSPGLSVSSSTFTRNAGHGIALSDAAGAQVKDVLATGNGIDGLLAIGIDNVAVSKIVATGNGNYGVEAYNATHVKISQSTVAGNESNGVMVCASCAAAEIGKVRAIGNDGDGIHVDAADAVVANSTADVNLGYGIIGVDLTNDGGGNSAHANFGGDCSNVDCS